MEYLFSGYAKGKIPSIQISGVQYNEVKQAKEEWLAVLGIEEKLALLLDNFFAFEVALLKHGEEFRIWRQFSHIEAMTMRLAFDRHMVNFLTSCRLYLDHTSHGISALFGTESEENRALGEFKSSMYDNHFAYRLMEALRNVVQHTCLPFNSLTQHWSLCQGVDENRIHFTVSPLLSLKEIRETSRLKKSIVEELNEMGTKTLDIRPLVQEHMQCLFRVHEFIRKILHDKISQARIIYERALAQFANIDDQKVEFSFLWIRGENGLELDRVELVEEPLSYFDYLSNQNQINPELTRSFTSNADFKLPSPKWDRPPTKRTPGNQGQNTTC